MDGDKGGGENGKDGSIKGCYCLSAGGISQQNRRHTKGDHLCASGHKGLWSSSGKIGSALNQHKFKPCPLLIYGYHLYPNFVAKSKDGKGFLADGGSPGWLAKILAKVLPF